MNDAGRVTAFNSEKQAQEDLQTRVAEPLLKQSLQLGPET